MNSSFVCSAAFIAKRQLDKNHTPQRKGKKKKSLSAVQQLKEKRTVLEDRHEVQEKQQNHGDYTADTIQEVP